MNLSKAVERGYENQKKRDGLKKGRVGRTGSAAGERVREIVNFCLVNGRNGLSGEAKYKHIIYSTIQNTAECRIIRFILEHLWKMENKTNFG